MSSAKAYDWNIWINFAETWFLSSGNFKYTLLNSPAKIPINYLNFVSSLPTYLTLKWVVAKLIHPLMGISSMFSSYSFLVNQSNL